MTITDGQVFVPFTISMVFAWHSRSFATYAAMSMGAFAVAAARERELGVPVTLQNLAGFGWERPFLGISMWVFMLGFPLDQRGDVAPGQ